MLEPFDDQQQQHTSTQKYQKHTAISAGYYFKCSYDDSLSFYASNRGLGCIKWFTQQLENISKVIEGKLKTVVPMTMTQTQSF